MEGGLLQLRSCFLVFFMQRMNRRLKCGLDGKSLQSWLIYSQSLPRSFSTYTTFTLEQVEKHNKTEDFWCILDGLVFDLTSFIAYHPGGN